MKSCIGRALGSNFLTFPERLSSDPELAGAPFVILINKMDEAAESLREFDKLVSAKVKGHRVVHFFSVSAKAG